MAPPFSCKEEGNDQHQSPACATTEQCSGNFAGVGHVDITYVAHLDPVAARTGQGLKKVAAGGSAGVDNLVYAWLSSSWGDCPLLQTAAIVASEEVQVWIVGGACISTQEGTAASSAVQDLDVVCARGKQREDPLLAAAPVVLQFHRDTIEP